jgi:hypothetical protein
MTTVYGFDPEQNPSFEQFLQTRQTLRAAAKAHIESAYTEYQQRLDRIAELQEALLDTMKPRSFSERYTKRHAIKKQTKALREQAEEAFRSISRDLSHRYGLDSPHGALQRDYEDYAYTIVDAQDRGTMDPVLTHTPGARKAIDKGWTVYYTSSLLWGKSELVRAMGDSIVVKGHDDARVRAGLLLAKANCVGPLRINGKPEFVATAHRLARELGLDVEGMTAAPPNTISGNPHPTAPSTPTTAPAAPPPTTGSSSPSSAVTPFEELARDHMHEGNPTRFDFTNGDGKDTLLVGVVGGVIVRGGTTYVSIYEQNDPTDNAFAVRLKDGTTIPNVGDSVVGKVDQDGFADLGVVETALEYQAELTKERLGIVDAANEGLVSDQLPAMLEDDPEQHFTVLANDGDNAILWSPKNDGAIQINAATGKIDLRSLGNDGDHVQLHRTDDGPIIASPFTPPTANKRAIAQLAKAAGRNESDLFDFTEPCADLPLENAHIVATAYIDGRTYALIDCNGQAFVVALDQDQDVTIGGNVNVTMSPEGTTLNDAPLSPQVIQEHANNASVTRDGDVDNALDTEEPPAPEPEIAQTSTSPKTRSGRSGRRRKGSA